MIPMQLATINVYTAHGTSEQTNGRQDKTNPKQCEVFCSHLTVEVKDIELRIQRERYGVNL